MTQGGLRGAVLRRHMHATYAAVLLCSWGGSCQDIVKIDGQVVCVIVTSPVIVFFCERVCS